MSRKRNSGRQLGIPIFLKRVFQEFQKDQCLNRASGLAFASLVALVPLSALLFSLFSAMGSFTDLVENLQAFLIQQLVPTSQEEIMIYVRRFVENTRALGVVGLLFFLLTSIFLLNTIQRNFNAVWGTRTRGNSLSQLATYLSVLIVGSFLISIGLNLTGMLRSLLARSVFSGLEKSMPLILGLFPSLFIFAALLLMIRFIPAGKVQTRSALLAAAIGAVLWEVARRIFFLWVTYVIRLSIVYGSLAAIPIFLIWLYVAWTVVLGALEIAFVHQYGRKGWSGKRREEMSPAEAVLFGLEVFLTVAERYRQGSRPASRRDLARELAASEVDVRQVVDKLSQKHLILATGKDHASLVPARDLETISVRELLKALLHAPAVGTSAASLSAIVLDRFMAEALSSVGTLSIRDVLEHEGLPDDDGSLQGPLPASTSRPARGQTLRRRVAELWRRLRPGG